MIVVFFKIYVLVKGWILNGVKNIGSLLLLSSLVSFQPGTVKNCNILSLVYHCVHYVLDKFLSP